jgi:hypothetical protein
MKILVISGTGNVGSKVISELLPRGVNILPRFGFRAWVRISRNHIEPTCEILRHPARADESGADNPDTVYWFSQRHNCFPCLRGICLFRTFKGSSAYAMPERFPCASSSAFLSPPLSLAEYIEPPKSVTNIRSPLRSRVIPNPSSKWVNIDCQTQLYE